MPSISKRHLTRKELKQPDEFTVVFGTLRDFVEDHLRQVIAVAIGICLAVAIGFGLYQYHRSVERRAAQEFYAGFRALNAKDYKTAEQNLSSLAADHPGTGPGRLAEFYLGLAYLEQGKLPQAQARLKAFSTSASQPMMRQLGLLNLGVAYEQSKQPQKAEQAYSQAAAIAGPRTADARLAKARVLAAEGKREAAIKAYRQFLADNPYSARRPDATAALARLGASPVGGR